MGCIYLIRNMANGKGYVGQTKDFKTRSRQHLETGCGSKLIKQAVKKYGIKSFATYVMAEDIPESELDHYERRCIELFKTYFPHGYNLTHGGIENRPTPEHGQKIAKALRGKPKTDRHKNNISKALKKSAWMKGKTMSEEQKRKISESMKGEKNPRYGRPRTKNEKRRISAGVINWNINQKRDKSPSTVCH